MDEGSKMKRHLVVLMGLDGSGKTSQGELVAKWLEGRGFKAQVVWMRGESYLTLPLLRVAKWLLRAPKAEKRGEADTPESYREYTGKKRSLLKSGVLRAVWRTLVLFDFFITFRLAFGKIARGVAVVILDRYVYDSLIDIVSGSGGGADEVRRLLRSGFVNMFPRPDKVVLLDLEPAEAYRRKDDIPSLDYLVERNGLYRAIARDTGALIVDASKTIEAVQSAIREGLSGWLDGLDPERGAGGGVKPKSIHA